MTEKDSSRSSSTPHAQIVRRSGASDSAVRSTDVFPIPDSPSSQTSRGPPVADDSSSANNRKTSCRPTKTSPSLAIQTLRFGITAIGRTPLRQGKPELGEPLGNGAMLDAAAAPVVGDEPGHR